MLVELCCQLDSDVCEESFEKVRCQTSALEVAESA